MKTKFFLFLIILISIFIRLPYTNIPLFHADEAIYALVAQDFLNGTCIYQGVWDHKPPGIYFLYALIFKLFSPYTMIYIRLFTIIWTCVTLYTIFSLGRYLYNEKVGLYSGLFFAIFSTTYLNKEILAANSEIFMILPYTLCIYYFIKGYELKKPIFIIVSGIWAGMAILIKQPAIFNLAAIFFYLLVVPKILRIKFNFKETLSDLFYFLMGILLIFLPVVIYFFIHGAFFNFINEAFFFSLLYVSTSPESLFTYFSRSLSDCFLPNILIWCLSISSLIFMGINLFSSKKEDKLSLNNQNHRNFLVMIWAIFSFVGVAIGNKFMMHYFIQMFPVNFLLSGYGISVLLKKLSLKEDSSSPSPYPYGKILIISFLVLGTILPFQKYHGTIGLFKRYYYLITKKTPFLSKEEIVASYIMKNSKPNQKIFVWGNAPQIYFLSHRNPASKIVFNNVIVGTYNFPKHIEKIFLDQVISDLHQNKPLFFVDAVPDDDRLIEKLNIPYYPSLNSFLNKNYQYAYKFKDIIIYNLKKD
ncbi:glycosyltransferase family 39 protein [bacterium]|nr:glycosyltransferase family 39 protein [bacterium]